MKIKETKKGKEMSTKDKEISLKGDKDQGDRLVNAKKK